MRFNYPVLANPEICQHCKTCMTACPVEAIKDIDPRFEVDVSKCDKKRLLLLRHALQKPCTYFKTGG